MNVITMERVAGVVLKALKDENLMGILVATVFFVGVFALYVLFMWLLIQLFGVNSMPGDVITTAIN